MYFSIRWERLPFVQSLPKKRKRRTFPIVRIKTTFLNEKGKEHHETRLYEDWIGVCTGNIDRVAQEIERNFPGHQTRYTLLTHAKKILPYFEKRLETGKLEYRSKPFYKLYTTACHEEVGNFFNRYKIAYFEKADWTVRLYLDLCNKYNSDGFYYKWYDIAKTKRTGDDWLLDSYVMLPERTESPDWTIGAFDIETVPMDGSLKRIPDGTDPSDTIVMISLYKWNNRRGVQNYILYLKPTTRMEDVSDSRYLGYASERDMLNDFHVLIRDCQILTGYNINGFDFPCIFSRLLWLKMYDIMIDYTSVKSGESIVTTYDRKIVIDLYHYFKTFSAHDLTNFKLDNVVQTKLDKDTKKIQVKSTGIWTWYTSRKETIDSVIDSEDAKSCFRTLSPSHVRENEFGTFKIYLEYCLRDSELVYDLFLNDDVLSFLVERANFTAHDVPTALYFGNSRYLLELLKSYGTRKGYFFNQNFFANPIETNLFSEKNEGRNGKKETFTGGLNFCYPEKVYRDVAVLDFTSMYPSTLISLNLDYGTCAIVNRDRWLEIIRKYPELVSIPYRNHDDGHFSKDEYGESLHFEYPKPTREDRFVVVINQNTEAFLPEISKNFKELRKYHQAEYKKKKIPYHKNVQQCIKILINSLYGVMANKDSRLAYPVIAMAIVNGSREQLLGSYHKITRLGYFPCYVDTDGLMVPDWPDDHCDRVNEYLNIPGVELKFEQRMKRLVVLSKKRYIYESQQGTIVTKGFQKKINELTRFASTRIVDALWKALFENDFGDEEIDLKSRGWILWIETLMEMQYMCRDAKRYSIYRKTKTLVEYKSDKCASVQFLKKYPEKANDYIEYTYSRADIAVRESSKWIMDAEECQWVDFEKLFMSQKKIFVTLLNMVFWKEAEAMRYSDAVLNAMRWKKFMLAEIKYLKKYKRILTFGFEQGVKYTFELNDHLVGSRRGRVVKKNE